MEEEQEFAFAFTAPVFIRVIAPNLEEANRLAGDALDTLASFCEHVESGDITIGDAMLMEDTEKSEGNAQEKR